MWFKKPYSILRPKKSNGKLSYDYRVWDPDTGKRLEYSTGQKSKQAAEHFCKALRDSGCLLPAASPLSRAGIASGSALRQAQTFQSFAANWWGPDGPYTRSQEARGKKLSRRYREPCASQMRRHILPFFGPLTIDTIIPSRGKIGFLGFAEGRG